MSRYYVTWLKYKRDYERRHYKKTVVRKEFFSKLMSVCKDRYGVELGFNECLGRLINEVLNQGESEELRRLRAEVRRLGVLVCDLVTALIRVCNQFGIRSYDDLIEKAFQYCE